MVMSLCSSAVCKSTEHATHQNLAQERRQLTYKGPCQVRCNSHAHGVTARHSRGLAFGCPNGTSGTTEESRERETCACGGGLCVKTAGSDQTHREDTEFGIPVTYRGMEAGVYGPGGSYFDDATAHRQPARAESPRLANAGRRAHLTGMQISLGLCRYQQTPGNNAPEGALRQPAPVRSSRCSLNGPQIGGSVDPMNGYRHVK